MTICCDAIAAIAAKFPELVVDAAVDEFASELLPSCSFSLSGINSSNKPMDLVLFNLRLYFQNGHHLVPRYVEKWLLLLKTLLLITFMIKKGINKYKYKTTRILSKKKKIKGITDTNDNDNDKDGLCVCGKKKTSKK